MACVIACQVSNGKIGDGLRSASPFFSAHSFQDSETDSLARQHHRMCVMMIREWSLFLHGLTRKQATQIRLPLRFPATAYGKPAKKHGLLGHFSALQALLPRNR